MAGAYMLWAVAFYCTALAYVFDARSRNIEALLAAAAALLALAAMFRLRRQPRIR